MLRPAVYPQRLTPAPALTLGYGDEELPVLPPHTKVVVTGNNRTRSVLVGLHGVVKKSMGLGGWHWLVLTNGVEVKLQRNALSVIEAPTMGKQDECLGSLSGSSNLGFANQPQRKMTVDMRKLAAVSLWRYWKYYKLEEYNFHPTSKEQLIAAVQQHFISQQLDESQVISGFLHAAKRLRRSCTSAPLLEQNLGFSPARSTT